MLPSSFTTSARSAAGGTAGEVGQIDASLGVPGPLQDSAGFRP